jgi:hypothetical protein
MRVVTPADKGDGGTSRNASRHAQDPRSGLHPLAVRHPRQKRSKRYTIPSPDRDVARSDTAADRIYATGIQDTSVSIINGATCNATHTTGCRHTPPKDAVGNFPTTLTVDHADYVIDADGADLSLIPTAR